MGSKKSLGLRKAVIEFLALPGIKRFLSKFDNPRQMLFMHYCLLYLKIYQPSCSFDINVSDRYPSRSNDKDEDDDDKHDKHDKHVADEDDSPDPHLEGCVIAKQLIKTGQHIPSLDGWLAGLEDDVDLTFKGETDFSIIHTSRNGNANLLLGPARFVNHDCNPNCSFSRKGKKISLRAIKDIHPGQEVTVTYAKNYFGYRNRECRCVTCEIRGVNGFGPPNEYPSDEDSDDTDFLTKLKRRNRKSYRLNAAAAVTEPEVLLLSTEVPIDTVDSETTPQSSRSPSAGAEVDTPATSIEPDHVEVVSTKFERPKDVPLKSRLRQRAGYIDALEDTLFKFTFDDDDDNFNNTREEWRHVCRSLSKETRELYTFHDYIFHKLSDLGRYKDLQRFYYSSPIDADPDLTLDCVNCGSPFFGPDDKVAPRRLPTRLCPRCHRHAIVFNSYWPSTETLNDKIELLRAWDFTSLKDIGVRGEFVPPDAKKKKLADKRSTSFDSSDDSDDFDIGEEESDSITSIKVIKRLSLSKRIQSGRVNQRLSQSRIGDTDSDSDIEPKNIHYSRTKAKPTGPIDFQKHANTAKANAIQPIAPDHVPRKRGRPRIRPLEDPAIVIAPKPKIVKSPKIVCDSPEEPRKKRKYTKRVDLNAIENPRRSSRLSLDLADTNKGTRSRQSRDRNGHPFPKRPLLVVPLNVNKPTCILIPPNHDYDSASYSFLSDDETLLASAGGRPIHSYPGSTFFDDLTSNMREYNLPCMMTPSLPASSPLLARHTSPPSKQSPLSTLLELDSADELSTGREISLNPQSPSRMRTGRFPKTKTYGLTIKQTTFHGAPSWKLMQNIKL